jgi:hypothetical protein
MRDSVGLAEGDGRQVPAEAAEPAAHNDINPVLLLAVPHHHVKVKN